MSPSRPVLVHGTRPSRLGMLLLLAAGFAAGVLLVAVLGGAKGGVTETTTVARRVTVTQTQTTPAPSASPGFGQGSAVPDLVGASLSEAKDRSGSSGFEVEVDAGGGLFGVLDESAWRVVAQRPEAGAQLAEGDAVHVDITRG